MWLGLVNLTQTGVTWNKGPSVKEFSLSDGHVDKSVEHFFKLILDVEGPRLLGLCHPLAGSPEVFKRVS